MGCRCWPWSTSRARVSSAWWPSLPGSSWDALSVDCRRAGSDRGDRARRVTRPERRGAKAAGLEQADDPGTVAPPRFEKLEHPLVGPPDLAGERQGDHVPKLAGADA